MKLLAKYLTIRNKQFYNTFHNLSNVMFSVFYVVQYGNRTRSSQKGSIEIVDCKLATYEWFFIIVYEIKLSKITFPVETRLA